MKVNPHGLAPLTATIQVQSAEPCQVSARLLLDTGIVQQGGTQGTEHEIPIVGLFPGVVNPVEVTLQYADRTVKDTAEITTATLPDYFPDITINVLDRGRMEPGYHLCDLHFADNGTFDSRPIIFDDQGRVRWYLDLSFFGDILWPIQRLSDGVLMVGGENKIQEYDMLGSLLKQHVLDTSIRVHHEILELPGGQLLIPIRKSGMIIQLDGQPAYSLNDLIILYDRANSAVLKQWDMAEVLDVSRDDQNTMTRSDWIHVNGLAFNPKDSTIIVSARQQGVVKIAWDGSLKWILAPDRNWGRAGRNGDGFETRPFLLKPVNAEGRPYGPDVREGIVSPEGFDLPWGQHAPELLPNGNFMVYDNGFMRNFVQQANYSRAVEYAVDEANGTVQQVWQYGKERGPQFFSLLISDVDKQPVTGNVLVTSGYIVDGTTKIAEVTYPGGEVVFEATIHHKTLNGNKTFNWGQLDLIYRSERFGLRY